ncbi:MAG: MMPL family transporter [Lachnospiraceae bacterium]|nr:MMPL family transporter [Lachnospiraceae bacterium]
MDKFINWLLEKRKIVIVFFALMTVLCFFLSTGVGVNYNLMDFLPDDAASTKALDIMDEEYNQAIPNMRVMVKVSGISEALEYKEKLMAVDGMDEVTWLDDSADIYSPIETIDQDTVDDWYKDGTALFQCTVDEEKEDQVVTQVREIIGDENSMSGQAVNNVLAPSNSAEEVSKIILFVIPIVFIILTLTTTSWFEPVLFLATIGVAILLNRGTNIIFGEISFMTNAAGSVLQLAVSMDYSIFLLHRFAEFRQEGMEIKEAMAMAVKKSTGSILSSGLTTVTGFAALILMRFKIGPDMGYVMAKAILFSLVCVLVLLPALALCTYKLIDKTAHRSFVPSVEPLAKLLMKLLVPAALVFCLLLVPSNKAQQSNSFIYGSSKIYTSQKTQMGRDIKAINDTYGESNPLVLMVPKGDMEKEVKLNKALLDMKNVTSVVSYVNTADSTIPVEYIPEEDASQLYSKHYSRYVIMLNLTETDAGSFEAIEQIKEIAGSLYDEYHLAGELANTSDLKTIVNEDMVLVNGVAIGCIFLILLFNFKSISIPIILTLVIETSIWLNLSVPYIAGEELSYIAYLIINSIQLGATIDYGILFTDRYIEYRKIMPKKRAAKETMQSTMVSVFTSACVLTLSGIIMGLFSTNSIISQLGNLIGRGAVLSVVLVLMVLPALLVFFDKLIEKTTYHAVFYKGENDYETNKQEKNHRHGNGRHPGLLGPRM